MKLITINYDYSKIINSKSQERDAFKKSTSASNVIYFFYDNSNCLYIGETSASLYDRCFTNTPKHSTKEWFKKANKIHIIELENDVDDIGRQALESSFILAFRPINNKKA